MADDGNRALQQALADGVAAIQAAVSPHESEAVQAVLDKERVVTLAPPDAQSGSTENDERDAPEPRQPSP